jgi:prolyl-tRNA editing enzyme YbaK/EbsC (Cys-tRNA(Pro) deacylase)
VSLCRFDKVYFVAGSRTASFRITPELLAALVEADEVNVCA